MQSDAVTEIQKAIVIHKEKIGEGVNKNLEVNLTSFFKTCLKYGKTISVQLVVSNEAELYTVFLLSSKKCCNKHFTVLLCKGHLRSPSPQGHLSFFQNFCFSNLLVQIRKCASTTGFPMTSFVARQERAEKA